MNKKGFTLVEVVGVLVVLAIISLIAAPLVGKYMETSREEALKRSADGIIKAAADYYANEMSANGAFVPYSDTLENALEKIKFDGRLPDSGYISISESGLTKVYIVKDNLCVISESDKEDSTVSKELMDCEHP